MMKQRTKEETGITLIALVITIIILLILAGISIAMLTGDNGILNKATTAKEETEKAQIKEEIELAIINIQIEEQQKGKNITLETLANKQLEDKLDGIEVSLENNEITGEYKEYEYKIDNSLKVFIENKVTGISIRYTLSNKEYTKEDITLTITATSTNGKTFIIAPSGITTNADGSYIISKNGSYKFIVTDSEGKTKEKIINIDNIDKLKPQDFEPVIEEVKSTSFKIIAQTDDTEDTTKENAASGIKRYEYYVNGNVYQSLENSYIVSNLESSTTYTVYVIAYDKAGNGKQSESKLVTTAAMGCPTLTVNGFTGAEGDPTSIPEETYDGDFDTGIISKNGYSQFQIDKECWGGYLNILMKINSDEVNEYSFGFSDLWTLNWTYYKSLKDILNEKNYQIEAGCVLTVSIEIPDNIDWIATASWSDYQNVELREIWFGTEDLTGNVYTNDNLPPNYYGS